MPSTRGYLTNETVGYLAKGSTGSARLRTHIKVPSVVSRQQWETPMRKGIPEKGKQFSPVIGQRVAEFYRRLYPKHTAKRLAEETGCSLDTAKNWLSGACPANEHLFAMWSRRGREFFAFVFAPIDEDLAAMARMTHETEEIKKRIQGLAEEYEKAFKRKDL